MWADCILVGARLHGAHDSGGLTNRLRSNDRITLASKTIDQSLAQQSVMGVNARQPHFQQQLERRAHGENGRQVRNARLEPSRSRIQTQAALEESLTHVELQVAYADMRHSQLVDGAIRQISDCIAEPRHQELVTLPDADVREE